MTKPLNSSSSFNHTRRKLIKTATWSAPVVTAISLPRHAHATTVTTTANPCIPEGFFCFYTPPGGADEPALLLSVQVFADGAFIIRDHETETGAIVIITEGTGVVSDEVFVYDTADIGFTLPCGDETLILRLGEDQVPMDTCDLSNVDLIN